MMRSEERGGGAATGALALPAELTAAAAASAAPHIAQVNVSSNSRLTIGPQFVSVTQNVHRDRVVKGGAWRVAWAWARGSSRGERLVCGAALAALALCGAAAAAAALAAHSPPQDPDSGPRDWLVVRDAWLAENHTNTEEQWPARFRPLRLVVVQHTAGPRCHSYAACCNVMRNLQKSYLHDKTRGYDLPYNFVLGNDGRVYEGRGWELVGAHTYHYNRCSLGLAFTGNYGNASAGGAAPSAAQLASARRLLAAGERAGWLRAPLLLPACDLQRTASPGAQLAAALRRWPETPDDPDAYRHRSCDQIYDELRAKDDATTTNPAQDHAASNPDVVAT